MGAGEDCPLPPRESEDGKQSGDRSSLTSRVGIAPPALTCPVVLIAQPDTAVSAAGCPHRHAVSAMKMMDVVPASVYLGEQGRGLIRCTLPPRNSFIGVCVPPPPLSNKVPPPFELTRLPRGTC